LANLFQAAARANVRGIFAGIAQLVEQLSAILFRSLALSALLVSMCRQPKSAPTEPDYTQTG